MAEIKKEIENDEEEKLCKEEFGQLIPYLELDQLFSIEIKQSGEWQKLFGVKYVNGVADEIECAICQEVLPLEEFKTHMRSSTHTKILSDVDDFYHPLFTSNREHADEGDSNNTNEANGEEVEQNATAIANEIEYRSLLKTPNLRSIIAKVTLTQHDILAIEFQKSGGGKDEEEKWQGMFLTVEDTTKKENVYLCELCEIRCEGEKDLYTHMAGNAHRNLQLKTKAVRLLKYKHLGKFCLFNWGEKYSLKLNSTVKEEKGGKSQKPKVVSNLKQESKSDEQKSISKKDHSTAENKDKKINESSQEKVKKVLKPITREGLIGVEYVVKVQSTKSRNKVTYVCLQCNGKMQCSAETMEEHLTSYSHRLGYCEMYYPDTMKKFKDMIENAKIPFDAGMKFVLTRMAFEIEQHHAFGSVFLTSENDFFKQKTKIVKKMRKMLHAQQEHGPSFSNIVDIEDIKKFVENPPDESTKTKNRNPSVRFTNPSPNKPYLGMHQNTKRAERLTKLEGSASSTVARRPRPERETRRRSPSLSRERISRKRPYISPQRTAELELNRDNIWNVYRSQISKSASELERSYVAYRQKPQKHPLYDREWSSFWKRRKNELALQGKNYKSYDFQPEWTAYFFQRLDVLFGEDLQKSKIDIRRRLNIPLEAEEDSDITFYKKHERHSSPLPNRRRRVSASYDDGGVDRSFQQNYSRHDNVEPSWPTGSDKKPEKPTVIHMLRLMTALEDYLGTTGSKILELLTKALTLEKIYPRDSLQLEERILTAENCQLVRVSMEKLKSKLYADLVEKSKINSFKRVIDCSEEILNRAETMGWDRNFESVNVAAVARPIERKEPMPKPRPGLSAAFSKKPLSDTIMEAIAAKNDRASFNTFDNRPMVQRQFNNNNDGANYFAMDSYQERSNVPQYSQPNQRMSHVNMSFGHDNSMSGGVGNNSYNAGNQFGNSAPNNMNKGNFKNHNHGNFNNQNNGQFNNPNNYTNFGNGYRDSNRNAAGPTGNFGRGFSSYNFGNN